LTQAAPAPLNRLRQQWREGQGVEMGYLLEGEADLIVEGRPDQHLKAGDSYTIPAGTVHDAKVHGDKPVKVLVLLSQKVAGDN
jgi:quercetin dioxygenase-like cupin family protein